MAELPHESKNMLSQLLPLEFFFAIDQSQTLVQVEVLRNARFLIIWRIQRILVTFLLLCELVHSSTLVATKVVCLGTVTCRDREVQCPRCNLSLSLAIIVRCIK